MQRLESGVDSVRAGRSALARWGMRSWLLVGVLATVAAVGWLVAQVSGFVVPLVIAAVVGALFVPLVDRLQARGLPRSAGALLVLLALAAVVVGSTWLVVDGIVEQGPQIRTQVAGGLDAVAGWLSGHGVDVPSGTEITDDLAAGGQQALGGAGAALSGLFSGLVSAGVGIAMSAFLLYYVLADWSTLSGWVGGHLGLSRETGTAVVGDTVDAVRRYFWALTLSALVTAVLIGGTTWALGVPLAFTIAVITFVTSYVPYLGAIVSGAFATLITLGSNGAGAALVVLLVVLVVQNVVQTIVLARLAGTALSLHPVVVLGATIIGAALAGMLGAALSSPAVAAAVAVRRRLSGGGTVVDEPPHT